MKKLLLLLLLVVGSSTLSEAQFIDAKFGKGLQVVGKDSTFYMKFGIRFQNLYSQEWTLNEGNFEDYESNFLIRRSRFKFNGWALTPKLKYKFEMGLSNRDVSGGGASEYRGADRLILDAFLDWNFYQNFSIKLGQAKLAGNRERVISSANLQFVDRSRLNSRFNIDRDMGIFLGHHFTIGENFKVKEILSYTQGEGRNITEGSFGGNDLTARVELYPFGSFQSKGDYVGSAIKREEKPKLAIGFSYDLNMNAAKTRGQNGSFLQDAEGNYHGKDLQTFFADFMYKHNGLSIMGEYAQKKTADDDPILVVDSVAIGTYYTGTGINLQAGYMFDSNWEVAFRYTQVNPDAAAGREETHYTLGLSKFVVGHKLKVQTDVSLRSREGTTDNFLWRTQVDIHF